jgi:hypothetical protein
MKRIFSLAFFLLSFHFSFAQKDLNVLFLGNSLTYCDSRDNAEFPYYNNMTDMLQKIAEEKKLKVHIEKAVHGRAGLANHATFTGTDAETADEAYKRAGLGVVPSSIRKILGRQWDVVAIQERADVSVLNPGQRYFSTDPSLRYLDSVIKQVHGKTVLYQGYAEARTDDTEIVAGGPKTSSGNCVVLDAFNFGFKAIDFFSPAAEADMNGKDTTICAPPLPASVTELQAIEQEHSKMAAKIGGDVIEIGPAFEKCKKDYPGIKLFFDESADHPSKQGAYLIACLFYRYLSGQPVGALKYHADISEQEAGNLRKVADAMHSAAYSKGIKTATSK